MWLVGGDRQTQRRLPEELRLAYRGFPLPAFDKCSSVSIVLVASLDGGYRRYDGLLAAIN
jgi:hypothetical protein